MLEIPAFVKRVAEQFRPEKIILFGSFAYGVPQEDSDVDILVILPFEGKGFRKSLEILDATDPDFSIDLLARLPKDTERRYREGDPLIRMALDHGKGHCSKLVGQDFAVIVIARRRSRRSNLSPCFQPARLLRFARNDGMSRVVVSQLATVSGKVLYERNG